MHVSRTARDALSILRNMPDADLVVLGFPKESHPMNTVVQNMVPPALVHRVLVRGVGLVQNDLTMRLLEVLKRSHDVNLGRAVERFLR